MSFPEIFSALEDMQKWALEDPLPKQVFRKAGVRVGGFSGGDTPTYNLWTGANYAIQTDSSSLVFYESGSLVRGAYFYPSYSEASTLQYSLCDLTGVAYVRIMVSWSGYSSLGTGGTFPDEGAFVPIFTNNLEPTSRADWLLPDNLTMQQWDDNLEVGAETWPPLGCVRDPVASPQPYNLIRAEWVAPPAGLESLTDVLVGVCAISRRSPERPPGLHGIQNRTQITLVQAARSPVSAAFTERFLS